jgi:hypothetical protein
MTGAVRLFDPDTSYAAAQAIGNGVENAVYRVFCRHGYWLTDDELAFQLDGFYAPTVKSARSRLAKRGLLVDSGKRRLSDRGQKMIVWRLTDAS